MSFKCISYLELWRPLCSAELNHLCNFDRMHHEEQFCDFFLNFDQWFRKRCHLKYFLSGALVAPFTAEWNHLRNFGRGYHARGIVL